MAINLGMWGPTSSATVANYSFNAHLDSDGPDPPRDDSRRPPPSQVRYFLENHISVCYLEYLDAVTGKRLRSEVEYHLARAYPQARDVLAEVVTLHDSWALSVLVAFNIPRLEHESFGSLADSLLLFPTEEFWSEVEAAESWLRKSILRYMMPINFLAIALSPILDPLETR